MTWTDLAIGLLLWLLGCWGLAPWLRPRYGPRRNSRARSRQRRH